MVSFFHGNKMHFVGTGWHHYMELYFPNYINKSHRHLRIMYSGNAQHPVTALFNTDGYFPDEFSIDQNPYNPVFRWPCFPLWIAARGYFFKLGCILFDGNCNENQSRKGPKISFHRLRHKEKNIWKTKLTHGWYKRYVYLKTASKRLRWHISNLICNFIFLNFIGIITQFLPYPFHFIV